MTDDFGKLLGDLAKQHQYVLLGDTNHKQITNRTFITRPEYFQAMQEAGVKHLFIEMPVQFDEAVHKFQEGRIGRSDFMAEINASWVSFHDGKDRMAAIENYANMAEMAKQHGIRLHFADPQTGIGEVENYNYRVWEATRPFIINTLETANNPDHTHLREMLKEKDPQRMLAQSAELLQQLFSWFKTLPPEKQKEIQDVKDAVPLADLTSRVNDQPLADLIMNKAGNDKAIVMFGYHHGAHLHDLNEMLGTDRSVRLFIAPSEAASHEADAGIEGIAKDREPPYGIYYTEEKRFKSLNAPFEAPAEIDMSALTRLDGPDEARATPTRPQLNLRQ